MGIEEVAMIIGRISDGFEDACVECLSENKGEVLEAVREQLYSGVDGDGSHLEPTYLNDPYLTERRRPWFHRGENGRIYIGPQGYLDWKKDITPPMASRKLGLPPRPEAVPNLFIDGTFHRQLTATMSGSVLVTHSATDKGGEIEAKYGDNLLGMSESAVGYFNANFMLPFIASFFENCGYR